MFVSLLKYIFTSRVVWECNSNKVIDFI